MAPGYFDSKILFEIFSNPFIRFFLIIAAATLLRQISGTIITALIRHGLRRHPKESTTDRNKRANTLIHVFGTAAGVIIWTVAVIEILDIFRFNLATIITGAGFIGLALGLSAQTTIRDYVAGIFIILDNQYRVGDVITLSGGATGQGVTGVVEEISLRITKLRDIDGTLNIVRNGEATVITNRTFDYSSVVIDIGIGYDTDIDAAITAINRAGKALANDELFSKSVNQPIQFLRIDRFAESGVVVRAVGQVKPAEQWKIAGEFRRRLLTAFKKADIKIVS